MERKMKDSGIPWIGMIPEEWEILRLKNIYAERTELSSDGSEMLLSISEYYGVAPTSEKTDNDFITRAETLVGYKKCFKNDFVSNIMLAWKGSFGTTDYDGIISPAYCVYKPIKHTCPHYYHYLLRTDLFKSVFKQYSKGVIDSRLRLYSPYFLAIHTIYPPLSEQEAIASWLDEKCGEIDELIDVEQKMIDELEAYRQATITETVTGSTGILPVYDENGNCTRWKLVLHDMRQTGISWIPEIPEHWELYRIKYYADDHREKGYHGKYIGLENIISFHCKYIDTDSQYDLSQSLKAEEGDVLFGKLRPYLGKSLVIYDDSCCSSEFVIFKKPSVPEFLKYLLISNWFVTIVDSSTYGTKMPRANVDFIRNMTVPIPPLPEQRAIADYLDTKCREIDDLIAVKREKIETLKQYRQSIIFEAVTGKIQVAHASSVDYYNNL